jgi:hypothetical protein
VQKRLAEHFDLNELQALCFDLGIEYENLAGDNTREVKTRELVKFGYRHGRLPEILRHCQELRPKVAWDQPPRIYRRDELPDEWVEPLQRFYRLVRAFNRNRHLPFSDERTRQGDEIAFAMREAAPFLFDQFDVKAWLASSSMGKRLGAIKYLDWLQDIEYLNDLLGKLATEKPFVRFHVLMAIDSMADQLSGTHRKAVKVALAAASSVIQRDSESEYWRKRILSRL